MSDSSPMHPNLNGLLFLNGQWIEGNAGSLPNVDPGNGTTVGMVSLADPSQVSEALAAAGTAFPAWSQTLASTRGHILVRASQLLTERIEEACANLLLETGKTAADSRGEILRSIENLRWNGEQASRIQGSTFPGVSDGSRRLSTPTPLGVVAAVTAWNFPAVLATRKLGAALAAGCTVVLKASEFSPATARLIVEVLADAGLPAGVVNLLFGDPTSVTSQLLESSITKVLTFTGSTRVGKKLAAQAAPNLIRTVLELGGHAPVIVWSDAEIDHVIATTSPAKFGSAGQSCVAPTRYFVHSSIYKEFTAALVVKANSYKIGHGNEDGTTLGAVAHQGRVDTLIRLSKDAHAKGAVIETGGSQVDRAGFFFAPTVLSNVPRDADIMSEEPFGPICAVVPISDIGEAIDFANSAPYSFAAYLFTNSIAIKNEVVGKINASNIGINQTAPSLPDVPLGGLGNSGYGYEGGVEGILAFTQLRLVSETAHG